MRYHIESKGNCILITQTSIFVIVFGLLYLMGCIFGLYLMFFNPLPEGNIIAVGICGLGFLMMIYYFVFLPYKILICYNPSVKEIYQVKNAMLKRIQNTYACNSLSELFVKEIDEDDCGFWYIPAIKLNENEEMEIGYGYGVREAAEDIVKKIRLMEANLQDS